MHFIEADLSMAAPWVEDAADDIVQGVEALLAKHAAFHDFLRETGREP